MSIKRSVIGRNCKIGDHVQIVNSTLLDNVIVEDGWVNVPKVLYHNPHPNPITPPTLTPKLNPKTLEGQEGFNNTQSVLKCNDILFYILSKCTKNVHQLICIGWLVNIRVYIQWRLYRWYRINILDQVLKVQWWIKGSHVSASIIKYTLNS